MAKNEFFTTKTVGDVLQLVFNAIRPIERVRACPTYQALDEVIATPPIAPLDLPEFRRSSMDGYAVRAADTFGASASLPAYLTLIQGCGWGMPPPKR
jgi:molybdopterin molybdotransferase